MTSITPDKVVGNIVNMGLQKHTTLHKLATGFMDEYFGDLVDKDGLTYLMLANTLIREINPEALRIAEDVSG